MKKNSYLVLDIGGSAVKYALMDDSLTFIDSGKVAAGKDLESFLSVIEDLYQKFAKAAKGIAISMPGIIDSEKGIACTGGAFHFIENYPLVKVIETRCKVPVWIGNDAKCAGIAEVGYGSLKGIQDGIVIVLGTGIGGCLIKDGQVHHGKHFCAGEFSNICVDRENAYDIRSRWSSVNGISGLLWMVQKHLGEKVELTGEEIFSRAISGDVKVKAGLEEFCDNIAIQIFNIQTIFDSERIAIGGGISAQPLLIEQIQDKLKQLFECGVPTSAVMPEVVACQYLNDANLIGALHQFLAAYQ